MPYPSILTVIRPDTTDAELSRSLDFANGKHLTVLVAAQAPPPPVSAYEMANTDVWAIATNEAREWAEKRADEVEKLMAERDQPGAVSAYVAGPTQLADLAANAARYSDLVLLDAGERDDHQLHHAILSGALFESGAPVLYAPPENDLVGKPETVLIAWNAGRECAQAVRLGMPVLKLATKVIALLIDPHPGPRGHGAEPGADLGIYLGHHGIEAEIVKVPSEGRRVEEEIARQVAATGADLLVMGAYSHSRLRERIFGGTTAEILLKPPCPVLLAH